MFSRCACPAAEDLGHHLRSLHLFLIEIVRPFESWAVLGRTGESVREIRFADLGPDATKGYFGFEFWTKRLLGSFAGSFAPGPL